MTPRTLAIAAALPALLAAAALLALASLLAVDTAAASTTPDSQATVCQKALDRLTTSEESVIGDYRIGRLHPMFFLGVASRPDEWVLEYERRVTLFDNAFEHAADLCPHFAPYTGPLPGHL